MSSQPPSKKYKIDRSDSGKKKKKKTCRLAISLKIFYYFSIF